MPFLPIADDNPITLILFQVVAVSLIAVNVIEFKRRDVPLLGRGSG